MLPNVPLPKDTVDVEGTKVEVRGLSRAEVLRLQTLSKDQDAAEVFLLAQGAGVSEDEAKAWHGATPVETVGAVLDRICELSGITGEGASKSDSEGPPEGGDGPLGVPLGGDLGDEPV